jgi:hypothetical protein
MATTTVPPEAPTSRRAPMDCLRRTSLVAASVHADRDPHTPHRDLGVFTRRLPGGEGVPALTNHSRHDQMTTNDRDHETLLDLGRMETSR